MVTRYYEAVLFDAGETLVHPHPSFGRLLARFLHERGHTVDEEPFERVALDAAIEAGARAHRQGIAWTTSAAASRAHWTAIYRELLAHLEIVDEDAPDAMYDQFARPVHYRLFEDALPTLQELKRHGYILGVVSNWESWLPDLLELLGVAPLFSTVVVSGTEGVEKPDPAIFKVALERMGVEPGRAVYVGDSLLHDVEPALGVGMGAVLLDRHGRSEGGAHTTVRSLEDLAATISQLRPRHQRV